MKTAKKAMNWLRAKKVGAKTSLLNKKGIEMMELKKKMLENYGTPLFKQLEAKVWSLPVSRKVRDGLLYNLSLEEFEGVLLSETVYFIQDKEYQQVELKQKLNESVDYLISCKEKGQLVCGQFGDDHTFFSDTVTHDSAYIQVTGYTEAELEAKRKADDERIKKQWMKAAKGILKEEKKDAWKKLVDTYENCHEFQPTLVASKLLSYNTNFVDIRKELDSQEYYGTDWELTFEMIEQVAERGTDFVKYMNLYIR